MHFDALEYAAFIIAFYVQELPLTVHLSSKHLCFCCINFLLPTDTFPSPPHHLSELSC